MLILLFELILYYLWKNSFYPISQWFIIFISMLQFFFNICERLVIVTCNIFTTLVRESHYKNIYQQLYNHVKPCSIYRCSFQSYILCVLYVSWKNCNLQTSNIKSLCFYLIEYYTGNDIIEHIYIFLYIVFKGNNSNWP